MAVKLLEDAIKLEEWMSAEFVDSDNNVKVSFIQESQKDHTPI